MLATTFEGYGLGNINFGDGIDDRWEFPVAAERPYSYARTYWAPTGLNGFYTWHGILTAAVSNKARLGGIATFTTSAAHGFVAGERVTISDVADLNGSYEIASTPTPTTFTVPSVGDDITSAAVSPTGVAEVEPDSREVAELPDANEIGTYNVPGNVFYNADDSIDYVINSSEDPGA
jgi:hypothetical protein